MHRKALSAALRGGGRAGGCRRLDEKALQEDRQGLLETDRFRRATVQRATRRR